MSIPTITASLLDAASTPAGAPAEAKPTFEGVKINTSPVTTSSSNPSSATSSNSALSANSNVKGCGSGKTCLNKPQTIGLGVGIAIAVIIIIVAILLYIYIRRSKAKAALLAQQNGGVTPYNTAEPSPGQLENGAGPGVNAGGVTKV